MKENEFLDGISNIESDVVERFISMDNKLQKKANKSKSKTIWLRFGAIAACFALIVSAMIVIPRIKGDGPVESYIPNDGTWPVISSNVKEVVLSADEVSKVFALEDRLGMTSRYIKIYTKSPQYLDIIPLPSAEYLPIYAIGKSTPSKDQLDRFINKYLDSATDFFYIYNKNYEIEQEETWNGVIYYTAEVSERYRSIRFTAIDNLLNFSRYKDYDRRLKINFQMVSILETDTDEQIKEKLKDTITYVCDSFGKNYTDIKISRDYSYEKLEKITVYLYTPEETVFPSNFFNTPMVSEYISLTFHTNWDNNYNWTGSEEQAFLTNVSLYETLKKWSEYYNMVAKSKMLTLEEAEQLLEKGYVFGGHSCCLCMAAPGKEEHEVDFSNYSFVNIEYVSNENGEMCIPFYAFYKYIGETSDGIGTYAKTYVAAIEVKEYEEYFKNQEKDHRNTIDQTYTEISYK